MQLGVALKNTASLKARLSKQTSDVVELQARNHELATDLERLKNAAADRQASDTRHRQTAEQLQTENHRLKQEIASSQDDNAFLEVKMKDRTDHIFLIREDIVTLQQREQSATASIIALQEANAAITRQRNALQTENERSTVTIRKLQKEKTELTQQRDVLQAKDKSSRAHIDRLTHQKAALSAVADTFESEAETDRQHRVRVAKRSRALIIPWTNFYRQRDGLPENEARAKAEAEYDGLFNKHLEERPPIRERVLR